LGETFEFIPHSGKYKCFAEQVSHHPPISVAYITSDKFILELEMELKTKFTGNSSDVIVLGTNYFTIPEFGDKFTWGHLDTCAHNVIIGGMWVDHFGNLEIINHTTGDKALIKATRSGWLGAGRFDIQGEIFDASGNLKLKINGKWNDSLFATKMNPDATPQGEPILLWKRGTFPAHKWNWPKFNDDLNWLDDKYEAILPPTDSRLRGDRRYLEKGDLDTAGKEKVRIEEEQRAKRKSREQKGETYEPKYFKKAETEGGHKWNYVGDYWAEREQRIKELEAKQTASVEQSLDKLTVSDTKAEEPSTQ